MKFQVGDKTIYHDGRVLTVAKVTRIHYYFQEQMINNHHKEYFLIEFYDQYARLATPLELELL